MGFFFFFVVFFFGSIYFFTYKRYLNKYLMIVKYIFLHRQHNRNYGSRTSNRYYYSWLNCTSSCHLLVSTIIFILDKLKLKRNYFSHNVNYLWSIKHFSYKDHHNNVSFLNVSTLPHIKKIYVLCNLLNCRRDRFKNNFIKIALQFNRWILYKYEDSVFNGFNCKSSTGN